MAYYDDVVPPFQKRQVKDVLRVAKVRRVPLKLDRSQLNDPKAIDRFLSLYGNYPSDDQWAYGSRIAECLGIKMTPIQAMNRFECTKYISRNKTDFHNVAPTKKQIELADWLARIKEIDIPREAYLDRGAWEAFMEETITRDDRDRAEELVSKLSVAGVDLKQYGQLVHWLAKCKLFIDNPWQLEHDRRKRMREMLIRGNNPYVVADEFPDIDEAVVFDLILELEAEGYDVALEW